MQTEATRNEKPHLQTALRGYLRRSADRLLRCGGNRLRNRRERRNLRDRRIRGADPDRQRHGLLHPVQGAEPLDKRLQLGRVHLHRRRRGNAQRQRGIHKAHRDQGELHELRHQRGTIRKAEGRRNLLRRYNPVGLHDIQDDKGGHAGAAELRQYPEFQLHYAYLRRPRLRPGQRVFRALHMGDRGADIQHRDDRHSEGGYRLGYSLERGLRRPDTDVR